MRARLLPAFLLLPLAGLFSQDHASVTAQANTVYVGADGTFEAAPDTAQLQFNVSVQENKSQAAFDHASRDVEKVRQVLRDNGVDPKAAMVGFFSVQPVYEYRPKAHVIGYRVTTNVTLKLKDFSKIGPITEQLADANVSESQTLNYVLHDLDEAKNRAVEDAYRRARNSADVIAHTSGRTLGELSYASVDIVEAPRPIRAYAAGPAVKRELAAPPPTEEFTPQNVSVSAHVNAVFNLK